MFDKLAKGLATLGDDLTTEVVSRRSFLKKTVGVAAGTAAGAATIQNAAASDFCRSGTSANYCPTYCPNGFFRCPDGSCGTRECNSIYSASGTFINRGVTNCRSGPSRCYGVVTTNVGGCGAGISINGVYYYGDCVTNNCYGGQSSVWYRTTTSGCWLSRAYSGFNYSSCCD